MNVAARKSKIEFNRLMRIHCNQQHPLPLFRPIDGLHVHDRGEGGRGAHAASLIHVNVNLSKVWGKVESVVSSAWNKSTQLAKTVAKASGTMLPLGLIRK
jgi:hypothetical protein